MPPDRITKQHLYGSALKECSTPLVQNMPISQLRSLDMPSVISHLQSLGDFQLFSRDMLCPVKQHVLTAACASPPPWHHAKSWRRSEKRESLAPWRTLHSQELSEGSTVLESAFSPHPVQQRPFVKSDAGSFSWKWLSWEDLIWYIWRVFIFEMWHFGLVFTCHKFCKATLNKKKIFFFFTDFLVDIWHLWQTHNHIVNSTSSTLLLSTAFTDNP